jgi:hypothetical protein
MTKMNAATKITISVLLPVAAGTVFALTNVYYVTSGAGATLFWRGDEAYLFLGNSSWGYHFRYIDYPWLP